MQVKSQDAGRVKCKTSPSQAGNETARHRNDQVLRVVDRVQECGKDSDEADEAKKGEKIFDKIA